MTSPSAVLLAAGSSARFGRPKLLEAVDGEPLVARSARVLLEGGAREVVAVLGSGALALERALERLGVRTIENTGWERGMFSSVLTGLAAVDDAARVAVTPADLPFLEPVDVARTFAAAAAASSRSLVVAAFGARRGHPLVFGREVCARVLSWPPERRLSDLFRETDLETREVECGPGVVRDADVPEDLAS